MSEQSDHITDPKEKEKILESIITEISDLQGDEKYEFPNFDKVVNEKIKKLDAMGDVDPYKISENMCELMTNMRNNAIKKHIKCKKYNIIINIPEEKYNQIINVIEKFDPSFSKQLLSFSYYPEKQKEFINEYLSTKFIDILDKLQGFSTFLAAFKKDS